MRFCLFNKSLTSDFRLSVFCFFSPALPSSPRGEGEEARFGFAGAFQGGEGVLRIARAERVPFGKPAALQKSRIAQVSSPRLNRIPSPEAAGRAGVGEAQALFACLSASLRFRCAPNPCFLARRPPKPPCATARRGGESSCVGPTRPPPPFPAPSPLSPPLLSP